MGTVGAVGIRRDDVRVEQVDSGAFILMNTRSELSYGYHTGTYLGIGMVVMET